MYCLLATFIEYFVHRGVVVSETVSNNIVIYSSLIKISCRKGPFIAYNGPGKTYYWTAGPTYDTLVQYRFNAVLFSSRVCPTSITFSVFINTSYMFRRHHYVVIVYNLHYGRLCNTPSKLAICHMDSRKYRLSPHLL